MRIIIKDGTIIKPYSSENQSQDIYIEDGKLSEPFSLDENVKIVNAADKYIIPGLVDIHVHFRDPGLTHKEDIITGSRAAAHGGFTTVCCMPNTLPVLDSVEVLDYIDKKGKEVGLVNLIAVSAMTINQEGTKLCDFEAMNSFDSKAKELMGHGVCGISEDGKTLADKHLMEEVCRYAKELDLVIMDHAEPEIETVYRDIDLAKKIGCRMHIQHLSKAESVELIRQGKADGINVTCEAAPHHFALDESDIEIYGVNAKMNPPLGNKKDRHAVIEGLLDDTIDIIATDHAPHTEEEKNVRYSHAPNGIIGLEASFPISYTTLVKTGLMNINKLVHKMSTRPLEIIGAVPDELKKGISPNLAVIDTENEFKIDKEIFASKAKNTPYHDMNVYGKIDLTIHDGKITWEDLK